MSPEEARDRIRGFQVDAEIFFAKAEELFAHVQTDETYTWDADSFWRKLPEDLQAFTEATSAGLVRLVPEIMPAVLNSAALTEADHRDLGFAIKQLRAALRLRRYRHWDTEVIHDEGTVLGVKRAGQSEDEPLHPERARTSSSFRSQRPGPSSE